MRRPISKYAELGINVKIGDNVIIGEGSYELGKVKIGDNCVIRSGTVIYHGTSIGNNFQTGHNVIIRENNLIRDYVVVGSGSELAPGNVIGDYTTIHSQCFLENTVLGRNVFIAPGVKFLDDMLPVDPDASNYIGAVVGNDVAIGGGSVILPKIRIGNQVLIGAGSVLTKNVSNAEVWAGNPARFIKTIYEIKKDKDVYLPGTRARYELKFKEKNESKI